MCDQKSLPADGVEQLVNQFIAMTLPKAEWTHEAHLRVGLWHVLTYGADEAMSLLRERIRAYNESVGAANTETSGYHETLTRFYVLVIEQFLSNSNRSMTLDELAAQLIAQYGNRELPLRYYSRERLFSTQARVRWMEPDLSKLN